MSFLSPAGRHFFLPHKLTRRAPVASRRDRTWAPMSAEGPGIITAARPQNALPTRIMGIWLSHPRLGRRAAPCVPPGRQIRQFCDQGVEVDDFREANE